MCDLCSRYYELFFEGPKAQTLILASNTVALGENPRPWKESLTSEFNVVTRFSFI